MKNNYKKFSQLLIKRRVTLYGVITVILFFVVLLLSLIISSVSNPIIYNLFYLMSSIVVNIVAAALWVSLASMNQYIEKSIPIYKIFDYLSNKADKIFIILAAVPSSTGQMVTGMGEALALGMLMETIKQVEFPVEMIEVNYASHYSEDKMHDIINNYHVIVLGGPNYNKFSRYILEKFHNRLPYIFQSTVLINENDTGKNKQRRENKKIYSGEIIKNVVSSPTITFPEPYGVISDELVEKDCGLIVRILNDSRKTLTVMAGGMTAGVWLSAKLLTEPEYLDKWHPTLNSNGPIHEYSIVFESKLENMLSSDSSQMKILATSRLL